MRYVLAVLVMVGVTACGPGPMPADAGPPAVGNRCDTSPPELAACSPDAGQILVCEDGGMGTAYWAVRIDCATPLIDGGVARRRCTPEPARGVISC